MARDTTEPPMPSKPTRNLKTRLADGLAGWLAFEFSCERGYLFSEYYLSHAVGQILRGGGPNVRAEVPHPTLAVAGRTGRPPSIDYVVHDDAGGPSIAVETKWAGFSDVTAGALVWDAFRLEAFARKTGAPGLLVFGGTRARLNAFFASSAFQQVGKRGRNGARLLPLPEGSRYFVLHRSDLPPAVSKYVTEKCASNPAAIADSIYCEVPQIGRGTGSKSMAFDIYVWEIRSP